MPSKPTASNVPQNEQSFAFKAPTAMSVQLVGDFTGWQQKPINLQKDPNGVWRAKVKLEPGTYHYRFIVDGEWHDDAECSLRIPNPFGGTNSVRIVP